MIENFFPEPVETLDARFKKWAQKSDTAPSEFVEAELRRVANMWLVRGWTKRLFEDDHIHTFPDNWCQDILAGIETEFRCYFEQEKVKKEIRPGMWKHIYGGFDGTLEGFIHQHGFNEAAKTLGWNPWNPVESVKSKKIPHLLRRYLIGIGYLYPQEGGFLQADRVIVHPNHLRAQGKGIFNTSSIPFIPYLTSRLPMHAAESYQEQPLTDDEMWEFFGQLVGMSMAGFPSRGPYGPREFREEPHPYAKWHLDVGAHLIPQRYIELEPKIETFEWLVPKERPENPRWR